MKIKISILIGCLLILSACNNGSGDLDENIVPIDSESVIKAIDLLLLAKDPQLEIPNVPTSGRIDATNIIRNSEANLGLNLSAIISSDSSVLIDFDCPVLEYYWEDQTLVYSFDYGDGCDEQEFNYKGKIGRKLGLNGTTVESETEFVNFETDDEILNGTYSNTFKYTTGDGTGAISRGFGSFEENMAIIEKNENGDREFTRVSKINYSFDRINNEVTTLTTKFDRRITMNNGDIYTKSVIEPLFFSVSCSFPNGDGSVWPDSYRQGFIAGSEQYQFTENGESGSFIIHYGNGECDDIVTVNVNGQTTNVDLSEADWYNNLKD